MNKLKPGHGNAPDERSSIEEIVWTAKRIGILFRYWIMPPNSPKIEASHEDRTSAGTLALFVIVGLTFAVRGEGSSDTSKFSALASGIAAALSIGLNVISKQLRVEVRDQIVISAYVSTITVMLLFIPLRLLIIRTVSLTQFAQTFGDEYGRQIASAILATLAAYICFFLKAVLVDRGILTGGGAFHGFLITAGSGVIVLTISLLSNQAFSAILKLL